MFLQVLALNAMNQDGLRIEADLTLRSQLSNSPSLVYAAPDSPDTGQSTMPPGNQCAAEVVDSLVVESNGTVVPVAYGMSHRYRVCRLR